MTQFFQAKQSEEQRPQKKGAIKPNLLLFYFNCANSTAGQTDCLYKQAFDFRTVAKSWSVSSRMMIKGRMVAAGM